MIRYEQPGWELCAMHDPAGRRGLWARFSSGPDSIPSVIEICAGREGDDAYVRIEQGKALTEEQMYWLQDALLRAIDAAAMGGAKPWPAHSGHG